MLWVIWKREGEPLWQAYGNAVAGADSSWAGRGLEDGARDSEYSRSWGLLGECKKEQIEQIVENLSLMTLGGGKDMSGQDERPQVEWIRGVFWSTPGYWQLAAWTIDPRGMVGSSQGLLLKHTNINGFYHTMSESSGLR